MENTSVTASAIMSFSEKLEDGSIAFYESLAEKFTDSKETFLGYAKDGKKNKIHLIRTYQETVSDALETGYSFGGLDLNAYGVQTTLSTEVGSYTDALRLAVELEGQAFKLYSDVAEKAQSLLATIPRAFSKVAKRRNDRKLALQSMLDEAKSGL